MGNQHDETGDQQAEGIEYIGLVKVRPQTEAGGGPDVVPDTVVVASNHLKAISARGDVRIYAARRVPASIPLVVKPFQAVLKRTR